MNEIYKNICKIHKQQLELESKVTKLEHKNTKIDNIAKGMISDFYGR